VASTVLVIERKEEGHTYIIQRPIYFISEVLADSKVQYNEAQKLLYALRITARKMKHYFEAHKIVIVSDYPIGIILHNKDTMGQIVRWSIELTMHDITFIHHSMVKSQVLAEFMAEYMEIQMPSTAAEPKH
jgi:hypothetical protein